MKTNHIFKTTILLIASCMAVFASCEKPLEDMIEVSGRKSVLPGSYGLTFQFPAQGVHGAHADRLGLSGFQDRQIGLGHADPVCQLHGGHLPFGQHHVQINNDRHFAPPQIVSSFSSRISMAERTTWRTTLTTGQRNAMITERNTSGA